MDWSRYPNFSESEFACSHCGKAEMDPGFLNKLQRLRDRYGKPIVVTSGYRCPEYNDEISSTGRDGPHTTGMAVDINVGGTNGHRLLYFALLEGFSGIGVNQKGAQDERFIHLDTLSKPPRPNIWSY